MDCDVSVLEFKNVLNKNEETVKKCLGFPVDKSIFHWQTQMKYFE